MIKIRLALQSDAPAIIDFQKKMALETENLELDNNLVTPGVVAVFDNPVRGKYYVAENEETVIASLLITYEWSDWRNAEVWWLQSVYVLPAFRRKGIFRSMYNMVRNEAEIGSAAGLRLYVENGNTNAMKTYMALGMNGEHYRMYEWMKEN